MMLKSRCALIVLTLLLRALLCSYVDGESVPFSGLYRPSLEFQPDDQSGAFLIKKNRFVTTIHPKIHSLKQSGKVRNAESAIDVILREGCPSCMNLQTRDFLDFFVESLSTTVEQLQPVQRQIANNYVKATKATANALKLPNATSAVPPDRRLNETMAVLVFNSQLSGRISTRMKVSFFQATFWSVHRYFKHVTVMTKSMLDYETVLGLNLPLTETINLNIGTHHDVSDLNYNSAAMLTQGKLVKQSLDHAAVSWRTGGGAWAACRYLYFSLGDQLLHARRFQNLYDALDMSVEESFLLAPHRMQTLPLAQSFSSAQQDAFWPVSAASAGATGAVGAFLGALTSNSAESQAVNRATSAQWQPQAKLATEPLTGVTGSCCDTGHIVFPSCVAAAAQPRRQRNAPPASALRRAQSNSSAADNAARAEAAVLVSKMMADAAAKQDWAGCTEWGARNFTQWLRVGPDGFAMPPVTVHLAHCSYSATARQCPLPASPTGAASPAAATSFDVDGKDLACRSRLPLPLGNASSPTGKVRYAICAESTAVRMDASTQHLLSEAALASLKLSRAPSSPPSLPPSPAPSPVPTESPKRINKKKLRSTWSIVG